MEIDHEIFYTVILPPPLIQEGQLAVPRASIGTVFWLTAPLSLPRNSVVRLIDRPDMTIAVYNGHKATKQQQQQVAKRCSHVSVPLDILETRGGRVVRWSWVISSADFPTIWMIVGQGPAALAVGAGKDCLDVFILIYLFSFLFPSLWETARYRLKYCLKGP